MRLHVVRHGETRHNVEHRIQGDLLDDPLNESGIAQAEALGRHYAMERVRGLHVARVYSSPLRRAYQTAASIAHHLDLPEPAVLPGMRELSWGTHMGNLNEGPIGADMERILNAWDKGDLTAHAPKGETPADVWKRAMDDLAPVFERHKDDDIVVVGHGRVNKIVLSGLVHGSLDHMESYPQANACVSILRGPRPWQPIVLNRTDHLGSLKALEERVS